MDTSNLLFPKPKDKKKQITEVKYTTMKKITPKQRKLEENRFSILTDNMNKCYICGRKKDDIHEIYGGKNRKKSMELGCTIPICRACHTEWDKNKEMQQKYKLKCQRKLMKLKGITTTEFIGLFGRSYEV